MYPKNMRQVHRGRLASDPDIRHANDLAQEWGLKNRDDIELKVKKGHSPKSNMEEFRRRCLFPDIVEYRWEFERPFMGRMYKKIHLHLFWIDFLIPELVNQMYYDEQQVHTLEDQINQLLQATDAERDVETKNAIVQLRKQQELLQGQIFFFQKQQSLSSSSDFPAHAVVSRLCSFLK